MIRVKENMRSPPTTNTPSPAPRWIADRAPRTPHTSNLVEAFEAWLVLVLDRLE